MIYLALALWPYLVVALILGLVTGYYARRPLPREGGRP
jgi:hypothetical protein